MNAEQLRAAQGPLKERYREDAPAASVTLSASATLDPDRIACRVETDRGPIVAGLHPATGGDGADACSGTMLLEALAACAGVTLRAVATAMGIAVRSGTITAEGDWDARGTLGVDRDAPVGLRSVRLRVALDCDADEAKRAKLLQLTERYCVVYQTIAEPPAMSITDESRGETS